MAAKDKKGRRRRLPSNANPRLPSRAWTLNKPSGQQGEPAWITRRRQAHHLTTPAAARTARDTIPARHPNRKRTRMTDYPRPGYYHAPDYIRTAARDKAGRAVRDMVLRLSGDPRTRIELPPPAQHTADLAAQHPLASLEAAAELEQAAHDLVAEHIRLARQADRSWYQIADALHLHAVARRQQGVSRRRSLQLRVAIPLHRRPAQHHLDMPGLPPEDHRPRPLGRAPQTRRRPHSRLSAPHCRAGSLAGAQVSKLGPAHRRRPRTRGRPPMRAGKAAGNASRTRRPLPPGSDSGHQSAACQDGDVEILSSRILLRPAELSRSQRFYRDVLSLAVCREFGPPTSPGIVSFPRPGPAGGLRALRWHPRALADDLAPGAGHSRRARAPGAGVPILRRPVTESWGLIEMWIEDPDGTRIVLVEVPSAHPLRRDPRSSPQAT